MYLFNQITGNMHPSLHPAEPRGAPRLKLERKRSRSGRGGRDHHLSAAASGHRGGIGTAPCSAGAAGGPAGASPSGDAAAANGTNASDDGEPFPIFEALS